MSRLPAKSTTKLLQYASTSSMATSPMASNYATTTATASLAACDQPKPSSLDTRTLIAAFSPMNNISASSRRPLRTMGTIMYQTSRQSLTAEARESLAKGQSPRSASHDGPLRVDA